MLSDWPFCICHVLQHWSANLSSWCLRTHWQHNHGWSSNKIWIHTEENMTPLICSPPPVLSCPIKTSLMLVVIERDLNYGYSCMKASMMKSVSVDLSRTCNPVTFWSSLCNVSAFTNHCLLGKPPEKKKTSSLWVVSCSWQLLGKTEFWPVS